VEMGILWTYDGELMHPTAVRSPSPPYSVPVCKGVMGLV